MAKFIETTIRKRICRYLLEKYSIIMIIGIISLIVIGVIKFTEIRIGHFDKACEINQTLETISFSLLATVIFFVFNDIYTYWPKHNISMKQVERQLQSITKTLKMMIDSIEPFKRGSKNYTEDEFISKFCEKNLFDGYYGGTEQMVNAFERNKKYITSVIEDLFSSYSGYLSKKECEYLQFIMESNFINNKIEPIYCSLPPIERISKYSNQKDIGRSLYQLYYSPFRQSLD